MSKEFQIRDGNLIASFDLENEDGDIDFCKLLKVSHGVADEIGMFVDYVATNKIIKDQSKRIADLEAKLAEKNKIIDEINNEFLSAIKNWKQLVEIEKTEKEQLKQQLAEKDHTIETLIEDSKASKELLKKQLENAISYCQIKIDNINNRYPEGAVISEWFSREYSIYKEMLKELQGENK